MDAVLLHVSGRWGHFRKPETNNNPLTHDFVTKTAMIGMIGAVLGIDREAMKPLFPQLSEDLRYGVALDRRVWKQSWGFTLRRFDPDTAKLTVTQPAPRALEFLREARFTVALALVNERSRDLFDRFVRHATAGEAHYDPVLGLHNCPAELRVNQLATAVEENGRFRTRGFAPRDLRATPDLVPGCRIGFERIPSYQNDDMWNPPARYVEVIYTDMMPSGHKPLLNGTGPHFRLQYGDRTDEQWCLI